MAEELKETQEETDFLRKLRKRKRMRGVLIVFNALLATYLVYFIADTAFELYQKNFVNQEGDILPLNGYSEKKSLELYKEVMDYDEETKTFLTEEPLDYTIYGQYLNFHQFRKENRDVSSYTSLSLINVSKKNIAWDNRLVFTTTNTYLNEGIPLFNDLITPGYYILYADYQGLDSPRKTIKINSDKGIEEILYTPLKDGKRKKITLRSKASSPALVIEVKEIVSMPKNTYDFVYIGEQVPEELSQQYHVKHITASSTKTEIQQAYASKAAYVFKEQERGLSYSHFLSYPIGNCDQILDATGELYGLDQSAYIRELGGYGFKAGQGYKENPENAYLTQFIGAHDQGKLVFEIGKDVAIGSVLPYIFN